MTGAEGLEPPIVLLHFYFYTDSIGDESVQMLHSDHTQGAKDQNQEELGISDRSLHDEKYPFIEEFSEFLSSVPTSALKYTLMTYQQRLLATALWEASNYGGSKEKCIKHLTELYGPKWRTVTKIEDHMEEDRVYCEYVLILEHMRQWDKREKLAKLHQK